MKKTTKIILLIALLLTAIYLQSCNPRFQHKDEFYNDSGGFEYLRFPLIKPYYVDRLVGSSPWTVFLFRLWAPPPNDSYSYNVQDVKNLSIQNGIIMAYSDFVDEQADQSVKDEYYRWFIIVPEKDIEMGFENEDAFLDYIQQLGIQQPDWREPAEIFKEFEQTGCLDWIPDCK